MGATARFEMPTRRYHPVSPERHGGRFWRRFDSYAFADACTVVPIVLGELAETAALFPLAFDVGDDQCIPVALLQPDRTNRVAWIAGGSGRWTAPYVPAALRAYPFEAALGAAGSLTLLVDESSGLITGNPLDDAFFTQEGRPSDSLNAVIGFLQARAVWARETRLAVAALRDADVLVPLQARGRLAEERCAGLSQVDPERLEALDAAALGALHQCRALALAHAHLVSLQHCFHGPATTSAPETPDRPQAAQVSGFLEALSRDAASGQSPLTAVP